MAPSIDPNNSTTVLRQSRKLVASALVGAVAYGIESLVCAAYWAAQPFSNLRDGQTLASQLVVALPLSLAAGWALGHAVVLGWRRSRASSTAVGRAAWLALATIAVLAWVTGLIIAPIFYALLATG